MLYRPIEIPPFETGFDIVRRLASLIRPKEGLTVSQWAERYLPEYDPLALPYLAEIMDACSDPETSEVGDMGPAQGGKSKVGEAFIGWSIEHSPAPFMVTQPDKVLMQDFVVRRIGTMIDKSPVVKAQLLPTASADNIFLKQFRGMLLTSTWPANMGRARPIQRGWLDDYDQFPADIDGQGDGVSLMFGRMTSFEGRETILVSSSPAWEQGSRKANIEAFIVAGTNERLHPVCPSCGDRIELDIRRDLHFDRGSIELAEETAHVVCPANGCELLPSDRSRLIASTATLPNRGFVAHNKAASRRRRTFHRDGLLAFTSWGKLARQWREAELAWELRQDEAPLKSFFNTKGGYNYRSILSGEKPVETDVLKQRREAGWKLGTVPRGVKVVNVVVDVQHDRFECGAVGYGKDRESWLIDRFSIDVLDDGLTQVSPFTHPEHWKVLLGLFDRLYPLAELGEDGKPIGHAPVLSVLIDTGGSDRKGDQATAGAKWFWNAARALGVHPSRITLVKGGSNPKGKLMPPGQFADQKAKGGAKRNSAKLWIPNVHAVKNMIDARLRRSTPGPGYIHLPEDLSDEHVEEITAEELKDGKWEKRRARNETWDILVYGEVALLRPPFAQSRTDMLWVPKGFRIIWPKQGVAILPRPAANDPDQGATVPEPLAAITSPAAPQRKARNRPVPRKQGWMNRLGNR
ncbi:terminase gpA endonuclease subunit [Sphingobium agri]|uniref:Phage terminase large subunit family protein n=1 Tax=Sphingobium agri TaxID=2933566 RepID=A0ABT0E2M5_9SPHN|nr:terminase gpA endonuclease subunit [Sphingobium agri]MCK0533412.1 phage terminase large subunit family protein [Sphingobium agri]